MQPSLDNRTGRIVGWFFIGTFVFSIPAVLLYGPLLHHHAFSDHAVTAGALLEVLLAVCNIGTAVALYPVARQHSERLALGYVAVRIVESTIIVAGIVSLLAVVTLRRDVGLDTASVTGRGLIAFHDWTFLLGPGFCAGIGNGVILGALMYRSGLIPRRLAMLGLVGGPLAILAATGALLGVYDRQSTPQGLLTAPEILWEAAFGIYLVTRGTSRLAPWPIRRRSPRPSTTRSWSADTTSPTSSGT